MSTPLPHVIWWVGVRAVGDLGQGVVLSGASVGMHSTGQNKTPEEVFLYHSLHYWLEMRSLTEPERCRLLWVARPASLWDPPVSPLRRPWLSSWVPGIPTQALLQLSEDGFSFLSVSCPSCVFCCWPDLLFLGTEES